MQKNKYSETASGQRSGFRPTLILSWMLISGFAAPAAASARSEGGSGRLRIHGFLTPTAIYTSDNNFYGDTDDAISFDYPEAGINGS